MKTEEYFDTMANTEINLSDPMEWASYHVENHIIGFLNEIWGGVIEPFCGDDFENYSVGEILDGSRMGRDGTCSVREYLDKIYGPLAVEQAIHSNKVMVEYDYLIERNDESLREMMHADIARKKTGVA